MIYEAETFGRRNGSGPGRGLGDPLLIRAMPTPAGPGVWYTEDEPEKLSTMVLRSTRMK